MMTSNHDLRHLVTETPRVMVVDGSRLVRRLISDVLVRELPNVTVLACDSMRAAHETLQHGPVDLVTTSLALPDGDGVALAALVRDAAQAYVPVIVVSGEVQERLEARTLGEDITDYFDKALGFDALVAFIRGYVHPEPVPGARILYVEDSKVVALTTKRMLQAQQLDVAHVASAEDAIAWLDTHTGEEGADLVLTDLYLTGEKTGRDVLAHVREHMRLSKRALPVLVMTGDENNRNQRDLLRAGANDLVLKPTEERLLVTKVLFQLRVSQLPTAADAQTAETPADA